MDSSHDLERNGGNPHEHAAEIAIGKGLACASQHCVQHRPLRAASANSNDNAPVRPGDPEVVTHVHIHERGHVEELPASLVECVAIAFDWNNVTVALRKRVVNLIHDCSERTVRSMTEEDAQRIEAVAEGAWHAKQPDRTASEIDSSLYEFAFDLNAERHPGSVAMVGII